MKCLNYFAIDFTRTIAGHRTLASEITEREREREREREQIPGDRT